MNNLSLRDQMGKVLQANGQISVRNDLLNLSILPEHQSLRSALNVLNVMWSFAPELRLHPDDKYRPTSVPWYLERVRMRRHRPHDTDVQILELGQVNVQTLISQSSGGQYSGQGIQKTNFFLEIDYDEQNTRKGNLAAAKCYVHFRKAPQGYSGFDIQYWFFYAYNGDTTTGFDPEHEGDWEHMTVWIATNFTNILGIFYASHHDEGKWRYPGEFNLTPDGHTIAYSSYHLHATYWEAGKQERNNLPDDQTADGGPKWETWNSLRVIGTFSKPLKGQEWIKFTGRWGQLGTYLEFLNGPWTPSFQAWWVDDDEGNS